ncbi:hypothetical protein H2198_008220 [Neophaeococcomyces mojaviensis]|uniref:Uncharacterized protein n=1 Tax=Neophaeococcomyces mojaviensis TaxID=3383035 RepID=A0ACC2ZYK3_9EURO|nr:hypothetical protein H2198_008220 [Knufia sp. JES_112]
MATTDSHFVAALAEIRGKRWLRNQLCSTCKPIINCASDATIPHLQNAAEIQISASQGCHLCSLLYGSLPLAVNKYNKDSLPGTAIKTDGPWAAEIRFEQPLCLRKFKIEVYTAGQRNQSYILRLHGDTKHDAQAWAGKTGDLDSNDSTGSDQSLEVAKSWLDECLYRHGDTCGNSSSHPNRVVPTRLVAITDSSISLRLSENHDISVRYLALSYCWGTPNDSELKLTDQNRKLLMQNVRYADLPCTIAEAVVATERLGYRYLWVDRLCILQGNGVDWKFEATRMGRYYQNSDCCLAALRSENPHHGLFVSRNPLIMEPLDVMQDDTDLVRHISITSIDSYAGHYPRLYNGPPYVLSRRAWVLQERLLAPRTIHFGSLMLYWECGKLRLAEDKPTLDLDLPYSVILRKFGSRSPQSQGTSVDRIISEADQNL